MLKNITIISETAPLFRRDRLTHQWPSQQARPHTMNRSVIQQADFL